MYGQWYSERCGGLYGLGGLVNPLGRQILVNSSVFGNEVTFYMCVLAKSIILDGVVFKGVIRVALAYI